MAFAAIHLPRTLSNRSIVSSRCSEVLSRRTEMGTHVTFILLAAATWDRDLMRRRAKTMAQECRTKGINVLFGPGVNIARDPRMGRAFECELMSGDLRERR